MRNKGRIQIKALLALPLVSLFLMGAAGNSCQMVFSEKSKDPVPGCNSGGQGVGNNPHCSRAPGPWAWGNRPVDNILDGSASINVCAVSQGKVKCWGENTYGQLAHPVLGYVGDEPYEMGSYLPEYDLGSNSAVSVAQVNGGSQCALFTDGRIKCWGYNPHGQLGLGDTVNRISLSQLGDNLPYVDLGTGKTATKLVAGHSFYCALLNDGTVKCWGRFGPMANSPMIGDGAGEMGDALTPVNLNGHTATALSAGGNGACAILDDQSLYCWDYFNGGYIGQGTINLGLGKTAKSISIGTQFACAILNDDSVKCWGANTGGALGIGLDQNYSNSDPSSHPTVNLGTGRKAKSISSGGNHVCAILDNDSLKCWGKNQYGQLGLEDTFDRGQQLSELGDNLQTVNLGSGLYPLKVSSGIVQTCALLNDRTVKCWGANSGRLGQGNSYNYGSYSNSMGDFLPKIEL